MAPPNEQELVEGLDDNVDCDFGEGWFDRAAQVAGTSLASTGALSVTDVAVGYRC
mgnify:CR=1 FL=1